MTLQALTNTDIFAAYPPHISFDNSNSKEFIFDLELSFIQDDASKGKTKGEKIEIAVTKTGTFLPSSPFGNFGPIDYSYVTFKCCPLFDIEKEFGAKKHDVICIHVPGEKDYTKYTGPKQTYVITKIQYAARNALEWQNKVFVDTLNSTFPSALINIIAQYHGCRTHASK